MKIFNIYEYSLSINSENAYESVDLAIKYKNSGIVGLDWCGNPEIGLFKPFIPVFQKGRDAGLKSTIHFGEVEEHENVKDIIEFRADRVGHATVLSDEAITTLLKNPIPIEICFTSNLLCKTITEAELHHFDSFYCSDYPVILCTDDKGVFGSELSNEYFQVAKTFNLSEEQVSNLAKHSFNYIFDETFKI